jgi:hypothetical protein
MEPVDSDLAMAEVGAGIDERKTSRHRLLKQAGLVGGAVWVAPIISSLNTPAAATSGTASAAGLWKTNSTPPLIGAICDGTAGTASANRGTVVFRRTEHPTPTIAVDITVTSGPALNGNGSCAPVTGTARQVIITQSDAAGNCLSQAVAGCFTAPNNTLITFSAPIVSGAVNFAVALVVSGGGGTDTYWTAPLINLP